MRRRTPTNRPRPLSAEEFAALAGIELEPLQFEADRRGAWTIKEHPEHSSKGQLKRQWRFVRRMPVIVQIIIGLFALTWFTLVFCVTLVVLGGPTLPPGAPMVR